MTQPNFRALCAELLQELCCFHKPWQLKEEDYSDAMKRARALLAQPVAEGPTNEDTGDNGYEAISHQLIKDLAAARDALEAWADYLTEDNQRAAKFCRKEYESARDAHTKACDAVAILRRPARWGSPAAAPVPEPGEVAGIAEWLNKRGQMADLGTRDWYFRAATLLQQQDAPAPVTVPVPVSERLPGPEDCDDQGRCWMFGKVEGDWRLISRIDPGIPKLRYCFSHWLPANALPLPAPEETK
jgi:hypothetical protein